MEGMNTRHLGIRFKPGLDRKTGELLAEIASSSQRISALDGAKKFSVRPHLSAESLFRSRGALQAMIGESLAGIAGIAEIPAAAAARSPRATAWRLENSVPAAPVPRNSGRTGGIPGQCLGVTISSRIALGSVTWRADGAPQRQTIHVPVC